MDERQLGVNQTSSFDELQQISIQNYSLSYEKMKNKEKYHMNCINASLLMGNILLKMKFLSSEKQNKKIMCNSFVQETIEQKKYKNENKTKYQEDMENEILKKEQPFPNAFEEINETEAKMKDSNLDISLENQYYYVMKYRHDNSLNVLPNRKVTQNK